MSMDLLENPHGGAAVPNMLDFCRQLRNKFVQKIKIFYIGDWVIKLKNSIS